MRQNSLKFRGDRSGLEWRFERGPIAEAFAKAAHRVTAKIPQHRYTGTPLEGRVALADFDPMENRLVVTLSTQSPHVSRTLLAQTLDIPEARIQVITRDVGGGFGIKLQVDAEVIPCLLSMRTGRPVLWSETRTEHMLSAIHARDYVCELEGAFDAHGALLGVRAKITGDCGCDGTNRAAGAGQLLVAAFYLAGNYRLPAIACEVVAVVTNKAPYGAYRGYGKDIANYAIERFMEIAARQMGLESNELRRRNLIQADQFPYEILTGPIYDSGDFPRLLTMAETAIDLPAFRARQAAARKDGRFLGVGFAMMLEPSGGAVPNCIFNGYETATVRMMPEGDFMLLSGMQDIGQGVETTLAQVVADEFGVAPARINVVLGETQGIPYGLGAWSSRGASFGVSAAVEAARTLAIKISAIGAHMLEVSAQDVELLEGAVVVKGAPFRRLTFREIGNAVSLFPGPLVTVPKGFEPNLEASHTWTNPIARWVPDQAGTLSIYTTHPSGCFAAIVEVDIETGKIEIERLYAAHDCGTVINPRIVEGQLIGGCVQGIGAVLNEELVYDAEGHLQNLGFWDYLIPQAPDVPRIEIDHLVSPSPNTSLGSKGMGEGGPVGVPPAVVHAVEDALAPFGVEVSTLPLSPERVLGLIDAARARQPGSLKSPM
ncbi:MAG: molybdopterin-dependent oxidoreductase [Gammaproteobacteria bacterium]|nr:molybdopterin-dependent oxidoreductase [Gammaproteobacteria bacterium]